MVLVRKRIPKRSVRFAKRTIKKHPIMKAVAKQVVRRALSRTIETKRVNFQINDVAPVLAQTFYYINLSQMIVQGTGEAQRTGVQVSNPYLQLGLSWVAKAYRAPNVAQWQSATLKVIVFASDINLTTPYAFPMTFAAGTVGTTFPNLLSNDYQLEAPPNRHDYTILYNKNFISHKYTDNYIAGGVERRAHINVPLGKHWIWEDTAIAGVNYLKGKSIYLAVYSDHILDAANDRMGDCQIGGYLHFKDA